MVRQDYLEALLSESEESTAEIRAVIRFIDDFTGVLKSNLNSLNQSANDEKMGLPTPGSEAHSDYMTLSGDLGDPQ